MNIRVGCANFPIIKSIILQLDDNVELKLSYPANYFNNIENSDLSHVNENGISNGYAEIYSPTGSISSSESVEIPYDIPDSQKYHDLGAYINSVVVAACKNESLNPIKPCPQLSQKETAYITNLELTESDIDMVHNAPTNIDHTDTSNVMEINNKHNNPSSPLPQKYSAQTLTSDLSKDSHTDENFVEEFADFVSDGPVDEDWAIFSPEVNKNVVDVIDDKPSITTRNSLESDDNEDFGDYTNFTPNIVSAATTTVNILNNVEPLKGKQAPTPSILERLLQKLEPSLDKAFGLHFNHQTDENLNPSIETLKISRLYTNINKSVHTSSNKVSTSLDSESSKLNKRIWSRLCNPDRLPEINQQWWKSPIFMTYLNAINVNPQHAIPAFASQLRLLEPVRLNSQDSHKNITLNDSSTSQENHANVLLPTDDFNDKSPSNSLTHNTNCNDTDSKINQVLDLDFFETRETKNKPNLHTNGKAKHSELSDLEAELSIFTIPPPITTIKPSSLLVEADLKLLEINKRSKLSESVRSTLNRLPMISYMRSKRLMFPVQQQSQD
ncbi:uncharacterized protein DC041_0000514 [Schistosoma bovis]|uniref:Aftiphilin clathrin-binding box domain-containing protein n=1 Tax=Schistosoma bovis TaxID=6184 RepID=A0A430Q5K4_SCHBO|nr:uncharacterized protein DC041_0000514 [Schistosoma bovis]